MKDYIARFRFTAISTITLVIAVVALWFTMTRVIEFSGIAVGLLKVSIFVALAAAVDNIIFRNCDTIRQIVEQKNIAYALAYAAYIIGIALLMSSV